MEKIKIPTKGNNDIIDITDKVQEIINKSKTDSGIVNVFVVGSTAGLTTIEYEPNLVKDFKEFFEKIAPKGNYHHHETWHDDNGHSHVRASLLKPNLTIPFENKKLILGTWQQIILVDFDTQPRDREIVVTIVS
jgi:secondary thiamine-phosphate synthase enzyme